MSAVKRAFLAIERVVAVAFFAFAMTTVTVSTYWLYFDISPPVTFPADKQPEHPLRGYRVGEQLVTSRYMCVVKNTTGTIRRFFEDGVVYKLPDGSVRRNPIGCFQRTFLEIIPNIPPGHYTFRVESDHEVNPLTTVRVVAPPIKLQVIP